MKISAALFVFALLAISQSLAQRQRVMFGNFGGRSRPLSYEQAVRFFKGQWGKALTFGKRFQKEVSNVCRQNYKILDGPQKRYCSCANIFGFLNQGGNAMRMAQKTFDEIWKGMNGIGGPLEYCKTRGPMSPRELNDICYCMTGNPSV